jgi:rhodanese-related sulfurtransferase
MAVMDPHFDGVIFQTHPAELARRLGRPFPPFRILDTRTRDAFDAGHIPGALHLTAEGVGRELTAGTTAATEVFVVGRGPGDPAVRELSLALRNLGARRVVELAGGMLGWLEKRLPVEEPGRHRRVA